MTIFKYDLNQLVRTDHELRKVAAVVDFGKIARKFVELKTVLGRKGYGLAVGIECIFLQFYYDLSDREMENRLGPVAVQVKLLRRWTMELKTPK